MFLLIGLGLTLLTAVVLVWPLLRRSPHTPEISEEQLAASFRDRQRLIRKDLEAGLITSDQAERAEEALAAELAERLSLNELTPASREDRQSKDAADRSRDQVSRNAADHSPRRPWLAAFLLAALPVLGISTYMIGGSPELTLPGALQSQGRETRHAMLEQLAADPQRFREALANLRSALEQTPDAVDTWVMLAMLHKTAGEYQAAVESFAEAHKRGADRDAHFLAEYAEAIALSRDRRFAGEPYSLLQQAMRLDGQDSKVVSLMAAAHYQAGERAEARGLLEQLLAAMSPDNPQATQLRELIAGLGVREGQGTGPPTGSTAGSAAGQAAGSAADPTASLAAGTASAPGETARPGPASVPGSGSASGAGDAASRIEVSLTVDPAMLADLGPGAVLFVSARAAQGPRMPIAVWRGPVPQAKAGLAVVLDAGRQIDPLRKLEGALVVEAHIARSGQAGRQPGDPFADPVNLELAPQGPSAVARLSLHIGARVKP
jgi:cytochrome c-type biogenesis protein CcmH